MNARTTEETLRRGLLAVLAIGLLGTEVELALLKHTDGAWQVLPLVMIGFGIAMVAFVLLAPGVISIRGLEALMWLFMASGAIGAILHFKGNVAYAKDSNPSLAGSELYREAVMGSTPTLAPGTMIQLGLVGLLFTFRHPRRQHSRSPSTT